MGSVKKKSGNEVADTSLVVPDAKPGKAPPRSAAPAADVKPEKGVGGKRRRLSRAFPRPLDKKVRRSGFIRDAFTFPEAEYRYLDDLKKRLRAEGMKVGKNDLLRAGLTLLFALGDAEMKALISKILQPGQGTEG